MASERTLAKIACGTAAAALVLWALGHEDAHAAKRKRRGGGRGASALTIQRINVDGASGVYANQIVEITFNDRVDPSTVNPAVIQVRAENATHTGFTKQVFGSFQVDGSVVRFFPRLPTHLRDADGRFFPEGSQLDNAAENSGFLPATNYELRVMGKPFVSPVRSVKGRPLRRTFTSRFSTASATNPDELWTTRTYGDSPPPQFSFSNPPDKVPTASEQYAAHGGTFGVPNDISVSLFGTKVPLSPATARILGNVELTMLARKDDTSKRRPVQGSVYVEQNFQTMLLVYQPRFPLADQGTYALRVSKQVKDLTEQYDFQPNRERERLRAIYDWLAARRSESPGSPPETLDDPPDNLILDWPADAAARGVLKANVLALGDAYPDEMDPRNMVIFTTRDEPSTDALLRIDFIKTDGLFDGQLSTGEWDQTVPGAASAILTVAGGSAIDGDLVPSGNLTLSTANYPGGSMNFRDVVIPQGVTVTITGVVPAQLHAINFTLNGTISLSGSDGGTGVYTSSKPSDAKGEYGKGGAGGPGGGAGGRSHPDHNLDASNKPPKGYAGETGTDSNGTANSPFGGKGGLGGEMATGTYYSYGGGGGGGGGRTAGKDGQPGTAGGGTFGASWNGSGGKGGAGSSNTELNPLVGGAGGGGGGNGVANSDYWHISNAWGYRSGSGGGGGGGAILIQTAKTINVGPQGRIVARGGTGGEQYTGGTRPYGPSGPGGGGGGGSILLRSTSGFNISDLLNAFDVGGGAGGPAKHTSYPTNGGAGGTGYLRTESPDGGVALPGASTGSFDPMGGGVPSFVYTKFADLGVQDPRILPWTSKDIVTQPTLNDAIYVEAQMTREDTRIFGTPDTTAIDANQNSTDTSITSQWFPVKVHDRTGIAGGAFTVPGWNPAIHGFEYASFPIDQFNDKSYRFIRFRIFFQLDDTQTRTEPLPFVDVIITHFQFNF